MKVLLIVLAAALVGCSQPPREEQAAKPVTCPPLPELPKTPTYASQLTLINLYGLCATMRAGEK